MKHIKDWQHIPLLSGLNALEVADIRQSCHAKHISPHQFLYFKEEEEEDVFYIILTGQVHLFTYTNEGNKLILEILGPGEVFGESILFQQSRHEFAQTARVETSLAICYKDIWLDWCKVYPKILANLASSYNEKLHFFKQRLILERAESSKRVHLYLKYEVQKHGKVIGNDMIIHKGLTHKQIADFTNTSRQTVSLVMNQLRREHKIEYNRQQLIVKHQLLQIWNQEDRGYPLQ